jgi:hypothetical protein
LTKVVNSRSVWNFQALLDKTVEKIAKISKKYPGNEEMIEKNIVDFLKKLPDIDIEK